MAITITFDIRQVENFWKGTKADIPWVASTAINNTLVEAQTAQYEHMLQEFTIRNTAFLKYSVRVNFAKRGQYSGWVGIADIGGKRTAQIWEKFQGGGIKTPTKGKYIAVPSDNAWPNRGRSKPERNKPRNLTESFVLKKGGERFIFRVKGKATKRVELMYTLKTGVRIPDKLNFYGTTVPVVEKMLVPEFNRLLESSIRRNSR